MSNSNENNQLGSVTGLWRQTDKNGDEFFTGGFSEISVYVFKNTRKTDAKQPDFYLKFGKKVIKPNKDTNRDQDSDTIGVPF